VAVPKLIVPKWEGPWYCSYKQVIGASTSNFNWIWRFSARINTFQHFQHSVLQKQSYHGSDMHQNWRISRDIWTMYAFLPSCKDKLWIASFQTYLMFRTENIWSQLAILSSYHEHG
jgi:hypothetical protein